MLLPVTARPTETQLALRNLWTEIRAQARVLGGFVGILWAIHIVNAIVFQGGLVALGIHPRTLSGLFGIFFAPLLHGSFAHISANTVPLVVLGALVMQRRKRDLITVSVLSALVGGLGTWLIAPSASVHVGASILIFGYLGYLLLRGVLQRRVWPIVGSVVAFLLYGGALWGVLPGQAGISWQGHLFGLIGGMLAARLLRTSRDSPADHKVPSAIQSALRDSLGRVLPPAGVPRLLSVARSVEVSAVYCLGVPLDGERRGRGLLDRLPYEVAVALLTVYIDRLRHV